MATSFRIDVGGQDGGEYSLGAVGESRHDATVDVPLRFVAIAPAAGAGVTYAWELIDRVGTAVELSASTGSSVTVPASSARPFALLVELRAYLNGVLTGSVRRIVSCRSEYKGLRVPVFSETADASAKLAEPNPSASTDNATYADLAGTGDTGQNWRGFAQAFYELVLAIDGAGEEVTGDVFGPEASTDNAVVRFHGSAGKTLQASEVSVDDAGNILLGVNRTVDGRDLSVDGAKLDGIESGAQAVTLARVNAATGRNAATDGAKLDGIESGAQAVTLARVNAATGRSAATDGTKLDGIEAGAQVTSLARINAATGRTAATDGAKLDGIESGAQVTSEARVRTALAAAAADIAVNNRRITSAADPVDPQDVATRAYVLANAGGGGGGGSGNLSSPGYSVDQAIPRFVGTDGLLVEPANVTIDAAGSIVLDHLRTVDGRDVSEDGVKLDTIETGAQAVTAAHVLAALAVSPGPIAVANQRVTDLANPVDPQDAATRAFVLANAGGEAGSKPLKQFANERVVGTTFYHVGSLYFDAGTEISTPARVFLGRVGPGAAELELVDESVGAAIASWSGTSDMMVAPVNSGMTIVIPNTGLYSLRLRADEASTTAVFRGLDWTVAA